MFFRKNTSLRFRLKFSSVVILMVVLLFPGCDKSIMFEKTEHIKDSKWNSSDTLFYSFTVTDTVAAYDFGVNIRNTTAYSYQNIYLFITAWYPDGTWSRDTAECILAAPDGRWLGKGSGKIKDSFFRFREGVHFRRAGNYIIGINQAMREDELKGIADVGIRIEHAKK